MSGDTLKSIIDIDQEGTLRIPKPFYDKLGIGPSSTVSVSGDDRKIVLQPYESEEIKLCCLKCRKEKGISLKIPFCDLCYNQIIADYIKENNKKRSAIL